MEKQRHKHQDIKTKSFLRKYDHTRWMSKQKCFWFQTTRVFLTSFSSILFFSCFFCAIRISIERFSACDLWIILTEFRRHFEALTHLNSCETLNKTVEPLCGHQTRSLQHFVQHYKRPFFVVDFLTGNCWWRFLMCDRGWCWRLCLGLSSLGLKYANGNIWDDHIECFVCKETQMS